MMAGRLLLASSEPTGVARGLYTAGPEREYPLKPARELLWYLALVYGLTWTCHAPFVLAARGLSAWRPPPALLLVGALAPAITAVALSGTLRGRDGLRALLGGLLVWRMRWTWYAAALMLPWMLALSGFGLLGLITQPAPAVPAVAPGTALASFAGWLLVVPLEELGWRGFALPRMQVRWGALVSGALLGAVWGLWHLPILLLQPGRAPGGLFGVPLFVASVMAASLLLTWLFNGTGGSLLATSIFHAGINSAAVALPVPTAHAESYAVAVTAVGAALVAVLAARLGAAHLSPRPRVRV